MFPVGSVVMLKSGGPLMTVVDGTPDGFPVCVLWNGAKYERFTEFPADALALAKETAAPAMPMSGGPLQ